MAKLLIDQVNNYLNNRCDFSEFAFHTIKSQLIRAHDLSIALSNRVYVYVKNFNIANQYGSPRGEFDPLSGNNYTVQGSHVSLVSLGAQFGMGILDYKCMLYSHYQTKLEELTIGEDCYGLFIDQVSFLEPDTSYGTMFVHSFEKQLIDELGHDIATNTWFSYIS